jgi:hypothetical protein
MLRETFRRDFSRTINEAARVQNCGNLWSQFLGKAHKNVLFAKHIPQLQRGNIKIHR